MTIKFRATSVFDVEGVCPGDLLIKRGSGECFFVVNTSPEAEELLVVEMKSGNCVENTGRIGYEKVELYNKIDIYDTDSE